MLRYVPGSGRLTVVVLEARGLSPALAGESWTHRSTWTEETQGSALRPGRPSDPFRSPRPLREGPAPAEPEKVEEEKDIGQEGHGHPLLQRGLHLPRALQPDPGGLPGGGGGGGGGTSLRARLTTVSLPFLPHLCLLLPRAWIWCWPSGPGAHSCGPSLSQGAAGLPALGRHAGPGPAASRPVAPPAASQGGGPGPALQSRLHLPLPGC